MIIKKVYFDFFLDHFAGIPFFFQRMISKQKDSHPASLKGYFLISESQMVDPNFFQTVVLILEHNMEGAFGLVVNRQSQLHLADIISGFDNERGKETPIFVGGPVQQEFLFVVHSPLSDRKPTENAIEPVPSVFFEPAFRNVETFFDDTYWNSLPLEMRPHIHLYLGYSGWAPGQLEREMDQGSWITVPATPRIVFHEDPETGWREALREKGGIYRVFAESNQQPGLN